MVPDERSGHDSAVGGTGTASPGEAAPEAPGERAFVSLYRRFRPGRFSELRGQPHVAMALRSAVRNGTVAHAYLFSGPRGTGKTSTARILARALDCAAPEDGEPCGRCTSCLEIARGQSLDVHELDAASNNGVEAMRDLVARAALVTPGRWKVYIVDEVHMLSNAAANALLKTLEEPPGHVVFVLATTDPQKVPATIKSRTQHFEFRLLGPEVLNDLLRDVRREAGLGLDDEALASAVRRAKGSARDALSALDQVAALGGADESRPTVARLVEALEERDAPSVLTGVAELHAAGWSAPQLAAELADELRQAFLLTLAPESAEVSGDDRSRLSGTGSSLGLPRIVRGMELLGTALVDMREAPDPRVVLEVALVRLVRPELDDSPAALVERLERLERSLASGVGSPPGSSGTATTDSGHAPTGPAKQAPERRPATRPSSPPPPAAEAASRGATRSDPAGGGGPAPSSGPSALPDRDALVEAWGDHVLRALPARAKAFCGAGRFVSVDGEAARFALPNAAHRDRCEDVRPIMEDALAAHFQTAVPVMLVVEGQGPGDDPPSGEPPGGAGPGSAPTSAPGRARRRAPTAGRPSAATAAEPAGASQGTGRPPAEAPGPDAPEELDEAFEDAGAPEEVESLAQARLLDAFPGAREVSE